MRQFTRYLLAICIGGMLFASCKKETDIKPQDINTPQTQRKASTELVTLLAEDFESGSKGAYASGSVTV